MWLMSDVVIRLDSHSQFLQSHHAVYDELVHAQKMVARAACGETIQLHIEHLLKDALEESPLLPTGG